MLLPLLALDLHLSLMTKSVDLIKILLSDELLFSAGIVDFFSTSREGWLPASAAIFQ